MYLGMYVGDIPKVDVYNDARFIIERPPPTDSEPGRVI